MPQLHWPRAFGLVDADCFYASCERVRHPEYADRPLCVLSSNDACIVAKCYQAKALGIKTGMPVWDARKILPEAVYLSADFAFYGQLSAHMFSIFERYAPVVEHYSIDEGFLDVTGMAGMFGGYRQLADRLRQDVQRETGVTVSVGISTTRTLAKMAAEFHKPNGTTILPPSRIRQFLDQVALTSIPGVARGRETTLQRLGITTAAAFAQAPEALIRNVLGKVGVELRAELNGESVYPIEAIPPLPKSVGRTASLGEVSGERELLRAHLTHHATRLAAELVNKKLLADRLTVFIRMKSFDAVSMDFRLSYPTANFFTLMALVDDALEKLFIPGQLYRGCGVIAGGIVREQDAAEDLFGEVAADRKRAQAMRVMADINRKYGHGAMRMLATLPVRRIQRQARFRYPMLYVD